MKTKEELKAEADERAEARAEAKAAKAAEAKETATEKAAADKAKRALAKEKADAVALEAMTEEEKAEAEVVAEGVRVETERLDGLTFEQRVDEAKEEFPVGKNQAFGLADSTGARQTDATHAQVTVIRDEMSYTFNLGVNPENWVRDAERLEFLLGVEVDTTPLIVPSNQDKLNADADRAAKLAGGVFTPKAEEEVEE